MLLRESTLLTSSDTLTASEERVGGKAMGLARLQDCGANVPEFWVLPSDVNQRALETSGLESQVEASLRALQRLDLDAPEGGASLAACSQDLVEAVSRLSLTQASTAALKALGDGPFAVRSSMVGEDGSDHSFAGQLDTSLFESRAGLADAIVRCWASAYSVRALRYRLRANLRSTPRVAVVVQRMLTGSPSGVAFSADPITGRRDRSVISAAWGQGQGVVSGMVEADQYVWSHAGYELEAHVVDKDLQLLADRSGQPGLVEQAVPMALRGVRCLEPSRLAELGAEVTRLAQCFGTPLDIEWTIAEDRLYVLQARPITALPPAP